MEKKTLLFSRRGRFTAKIELTQKGSKTAHIKVKTGKLQRVSLHVENRKNVKGDIGQEHNDI